MDPGPAILAPSSAQGGCQSKPRPTTTTRPCRRSVRCVRRRPARQPAPAAVLPGARAPRRRLQTGLGLPWLGSETSLLRSLRRPRCAPSGPCRAIARLHGRSLWSTRRRVHAAWRRRPRARGALALLALALCAPGAGAGLSGGSRLW